MTTRSRITPPPPPELHRPETPSAIRIGVGTRSRKDRLGWWAVWSLLAAAFAQLPLGILWLGFDTTLPRPVLVLYEGLLLAGVLFIGAVWMALPFLQDWVRFGFQLLAWWRADQQTVAAHHVEVASREGHTARWFTHRPKDPETTTINTGDIVDRTARDEVAALRKEWEARARIMGQAPASSRARLNITEDDQVDITESGVTPPVAYLDSTEYSILAALLDDKPITARAWVPDQATKASFNRAIGNLIAARVLVGRGGNRPPDWHADLARAGEGTRHALAAARLAALPPGVQLTPRTKRA